MAGRGEDPGADREAGRCRQAWPHGRLLQVGFRNAAIETQHGDSDHHAWQLPLHGSGLKWFSRVEAAVQLLGLQTWDA